MRQDTFRAKPTARVFRGGKKSTLTPPPASAHPEGDEGGLEGRLIPRLVQAPDVQRPLLRPELHGHRVPGPAEAEGGREGAAAAAAPPRAAHWLQSGVSSH